MEKRVVVTGLGLVSPIGNTVSDCWANATNGKSGVTHITKFDTSRLKTQIAAQADDIRMDEILHPKEDRKLQDFVRYSVYSTHNAFQDAGITVDETNADDIGSCIGIGIGGLYDIYKASLTSKENPNKISPFFIPMSITNMSVGYISIHFGLKNLSVTTTSACASGNHAIGTAYRHIQRGDAKVMVSGGFEGTICEIAIAGFNACKALSKRNDSPETASRPYDRDRDGFVLGEGGAVLILEELEHAKNRDAKIYAEILGYGVSSDAFHITMPNEYGPMRSIKTALKDSGRNPEDVDYINTHGTSTPAGDINELKAIQSALGEHSKSVSISSTKSMTGHLLGGAGALESFFTIKSIETGVIPPTMNIFNLDPECDLDVTPNVAKERNVEFALNNAFGFGGANSTLAFGSFKN